MTDLMVKTVLLALGSVVRANLKDYQERQTLELLTRNADLIEDFAVTANADVAEHEKRLQEEKRLNEHGDPNELPCVKEYAELCPLHFAALSETECEPDEYYLAHTNPYNAECRTIRNFRLTLEEKPRKEDECGLDYPCKDPCEPNMTTLCPRLWTRQPNGHCTAPAHYVPFQLYGGMMTVHDTGVIEGLPVGMMKNDAPGAEDVKAEDAEIDTDGEGPERKPKEFWSPSRDGCPAELDFASLTLTERMDWGPVCGGSWECQVDSPRNYEAPCPKYFQVDGDSCVPVGEHSMFGICPAEIPIFKTAEEKQNHEAECPDRQWPPLESLEADCDHRAWDDPCPEGWTFQTLSNATTTTTTVSIPVKAKGAGDTGNTILRGIAESMLHHALQPPNGPLVEVSTTTAVPGQPETWVCLAAATYTGPCSPIQHHLHRLPREAKRAWVARCKAPYRCLDCPPSERLYEQPCPRYWRPSSTRSHRLQQRSNLVPGAGAAYSNSESGPPSWVLTNHHQSGSETRQVFRKPKPKIHAPKSPTSSTYVTCHPPHFYHGPCNAPRGFPDHPAKKMAAELHCEVSWPCAGRLPLPYRAPRKQASAQGAVHEMTGGVN